MNKLVSLDYLNDYNIEELKNVISVALDNLNIRNNFNAKMKILLKVCLPEPVSKDSAECTHPALVRAVVDVLSKMGVECIVAESPKKHSLSYLDEVYLNTGMLEMANLTTCTLNRNLSTSTIEFPEGVKTKNLTMLNIVNQVDAIINIGKLKIDEKLGYFGACYNLFGLVPSQMQSLILNNMNCLSDLNNYILDLIINLKNKLVLNILDAVVCLEAGKTQRMLNCVAISECPFSLDASMFDILGIKYEHTILKQASERCLFNLDKPYKTISEKVEMFKVEDFALTDFDCRKSLPTSHSYFKSHQQRPYIDKKCKGCKICSKICPTNAIMMKYDAAGELYAEIDYTKCIYCNKCLTACPYSVVKQIIPSGYKKMQKKFNKFNKENNK